MIAYSFLKFLDNVLDYHLMMPFFNRTGLEHVGIVGPDLDCCWAGLQALALLSSTKKKERRRAGGGFACGRSDA